MNWFNSFIASTLPAVPKPIVRRLSSRYIAGETVDQAFEVIRRLNADGMMATVDILGEFTTNLDEAAATSAAYRSVLEAIQRERLDCNVSLKLTQMGLLIDAETCYRLAREVVADAQRRMNFVRLDMEDSSCTDPTLDLYRRLRSEFNNVGCALQAYLRRTAADIADLAPEGVNVRLCKGIYVEPERIALKDPLEINRSFESALEDLLDAECYVGIATHDEHLVEAAYRTIERRGLPPERYEFQMLLGVAEELRARILARGHRLRVYVPFGSHWYAYSLRRLKENPQLAGYALKGIFGG